MAQKRILAIDDDKHQLASLRRVLRRSGYELTTATNGRDGLKQVVAVCPDLILLDVTMPVMSGHEFMRKLRQLFRSPWSSSAKVAAYRMPPVIMVSGLDRVHQRVGGLDAGAVDFIVKPYEPDELRARIRRYLRPIGNQETGDIEEGVSCASELVPHVEALCDELAGVLREFASRTRTSGEFRRQEIAEAQRAVRDKIHEVAQLVSVSSSEYSGKGAA